MNNENMCMELELPKQHNDLFTVKEKTIPQYLYKPVAGLFIVESIVYGIDRPSTFKNYVATCGTEMEAINMIQRLLGIT